MKISDTETFWVVLRHWQNDNDIEDVVLQDHRYYMKEEAEVALYHENLDGIDKGCEGKLIKVNAKYSYDVEV